MCCRCGCICQAAATVSAHRLPLSAPVSLLQLEATCRVTGSGACTKPSCWPGQVLLCGSAACQVGVNLPSGLQPSLPKLLPEVLKPDYTLKYNITSRNA